MSKYLDLLLMEIIFRPSILDSSLVSILYLSLLLLIMTLFIVKFLILLSSDFLTTSTSGNSGI